MPIQILHPRPWWPVPENPEHNRPHVKQLAALLLADVRDILYGGAAGGGKSDYLLMRSSLFCDEPDYHALLIRKSYKDLTQSDGLLDRALKWWDGGVCGIKYSAKDARFTWPSGATVEFGHMQDARSHYRYQGGQYQFIGVDEGSQIPEYQHRYLHSRLRRSSTSDVPTQYAIASNPGDMSHDYLKYTYVKTPNTMENVFIPSLMDENPGIDHEDYRNQLAVLDPITRAQLEAGDWDAQPEGGFFDVDYLNFVEKPPFDDYISARSWDFAATPPDRTTKPAYTAGVRIHYNSGRYYIDDMRRFQKAPAEVEKEVSDAGTIDGYGIQVIIEEEPGSSGLAVVSHYSRNVLPGYAVYGNKVTGPKIERAQIMASAIRNGNVYIRRADWNFPLVDELRAFPYGMYADQVDALSQAFEYFTKPKPYVWGVDYE